MTPTTTFHLDLDLESLRAKLPESPGVYLFKDASGERIYIGKAKNLKKRVLSYFRPPAELPYKTGLMVRRAAGLDVILTDTEPEAFLLESTLIKKHLPRYNIVLRDDKAYPCLRLDVQNPFPRLSIVRRIKKDGARYFGPYASAQDVRKTLGLVNRIFQLRKCKTHTLPKRSRPCLNYQLNRCLGACVHEVSQTAYRDMVDQVRLFLEGRNTELVGRLKKRMEKASRDLDFEQAARVRDQIRAVEHVVQGQHVVSAKLEDQDIIALEREEGHFQVVVLFVRKGYLTGARDYLIHDLEATPREVMEAFLKQYYHKERFIPRRILVSEAVEDLPSFGAWVSEMAGNRVSVEHPRRGEKVHLVELARKNAANLLENRRDAAPPQDLLALAARVLSLEGIPRTIEGLDISNIQGDLPVGAVVSFVDGLPNRAGYRNFKIRDVDGVDDYGMMSEMVFRRMDLGDLPDLFLVDGGRGHLMVLARAVEASSTEKVPGLASIAKGREPGEPDRIYIPGRKNPVNLRPDHPLLHLFMRIRDEAHRRAISYHRRLRSRAVKDSELDAIPGIGPMRKRLLLNHFGDAAAVKRATVPELEAVDGIDAALADGIFRFFRQGGQKDTASPAKG